MGIWDDPEVEKLLEDPEISAAAQAKDLQKLDAILRAKLKAAPDETTRATIEKLLKNRRLFLQNISAAPSMTTVRGIGTMLYGSSDREPDGTYIATQFFVFLFLPLYPIAQYVVKAQGGMRYTFYGRVPLSQVMIWWRRILFGLILGGAAFGVAAGWYSSTFSTMHIVNGLDVPVVLKVDGKATRVGQGGGREPVRMKAGSHHVSVALESGRVLDEEDITTRGGIDFVAYNVLGVAPLYSEEITWTASGSTPPEGQHHLYIGEKLVSQDGVKYVFETPPSSLEVSDTAKSVSHWHAEMAMGGWKMALNFALATKNPKAALDVARAVWLAQPEEETASVTAMGLARVQTGEEGAIALARKMIATVPDAVEPHRALQSVLFDLGRIAEVRDEYAREAAAHPESIEKQYLSLRLEDHATQIARYPALVAKASRNARVRRGYAWALFMAGKFAEAVTELRAVEAMDAAAAPFFAQREILALLAQGKADEAVDRLASQCADQNFVVQMDLAVLYAEAVRMQAEQNAAKTGDAGAVAKRPNDVCLKRMVQKPEYELPLRAIFDARLGKQHTGPAASDATVRSTVELLEAFVADPERAALVAASMADDVFADVPDAVIVALAVNRRRAGDDAAATKLLVHVSTNVDARAALRALVMQEKASSDLSDLPYDVRAALRLGELGRPGLTKAEQADLVKEIGALDLSKGIVTRAMNSWLGEKEKPKKPASTTSPPSPLLRVKTL